MSAEFFNIVNKVKKELSNSKFSREAIKELSKLPKRLLSNSSKVTKTSIVIKILSNKIHCEYIELLRKQPEFLNDVSEFLKNWTNFSSEFAMSYLRIPRAFNDQLVILIWLSNNFLQDVAVSKIDENMQVEKYNSPSIINKSYENSFRNLLKNENTLALKIVCNIVETFYNCSKNEKLRDFLLDSKSCSLSVNVFLPLITTTDKRLKELVILLLANLVNESQSVVFEKNESDILEILLDDIIESKERPLVEVLFAINNLAGKDNLKLPLVEFNLLDKLQIILEKNKELSDDEECLICEIVWNLAFQDEIRFKISQEDKLMNIVNILAKSESSPRCRRAANGILILVNDFLKINTTAKNEIDNNFVIIPQIPPPPPPPPSPFQSAHSIQQPPPPPLPSQVPSAHSIPQPPPPATQISFSSNKSSELISQLQVPQRPPPPSLNKDMLLTEIQNSSVNRSLGVSTKQDSNLSTAILKSLDKRMGVTESSSSDSENDNSGWSDDIDDNFFKPEERNKKENLPQVIVNKTTSIIKSIDNLEKSSSQSNHFMLSYEWNHQETVLKIKNKLQNEGYRIWMDIEQMKGSTLQAMADAVEKSYAVLICVSRRYKNSPNCRMEAEYAIAKRKPCIPLYMEENYKPDGWLGIIVGSKLYYNFSGEFDFDDKINELIVNELHYLDGKEEEIKKSLVNDVLSSELKKGTMDNIVMDKKVQDILNMYKISNVEKLNKLTFDELIFLKKVQRIAPEYFFKHLCPTKLHLKSISDLMNFDKLLEKIEIVEEKNNIVLKKNAKKFNIFR